MRSIPGLSRPTVRRLAVCGVLAVLGAPGAASAGALPSGGGVYEALGDSYTSGPLIPNQHGNPIGCGRSDHNYPSLVAAAIHPSVFRDVSCGSAVTDNMTRPQSVPLGGTNPPQFVALSRDATLVTVGIGGNDANLVGIGESCSRLDASTPTGSPCKDHYRVGGRDTAAAGVDAIAPKIASVLRGIHARAPRARTLVVGYPAVLPLSGPGCWPVVPLSSGDVPWFRSLLVRINRVLAAQARANRAQYVDTYTRSAGHDMCQPPAAKWFEGIVPTMPAYPLHPNALGEASMARSVLIVLSHPAPTSTLLNSHLRITRWGFRGRRLSVGGSISGVYRGRVVVVFTAGVRRDRIRARATAVVKRGRWRVVLRVGDRGGIPAGMVTVSTQARDGVCAGSAHVLTRSVPSLRARADSVVLAR
jgi:hypothetical protein